jgi:hypothetical protein
MVHGSTLAIPIVDLNKLLDPQSTEECVKLVSTCQAVRTGASFRYTKASS